MKPVEYDVYLSCRDSDGPGMASEVAAGLTRLGFRVCVGGRGPGAGTGSERLESDRRHSRLRPALRPGVGGAGGRRRRSAGRRSSPTPSRPAGTSSCSRTPRTPIPLAEARQPGRAKLAAWQHVSYDRERSRESIALVAHGCSVRPMLTTAGSCESRSGRSWPWAWCWPSPWRAGLFPSRCAGGTARRRRSAAAVHAALDRRRGTDGERPVGRVSPRGRQRRRRGRPAQGRVQPRERRVRVRGGQRLAERDFAALSRRHAARVEPRAGGHGLRGARGWPLVHGGSARGPRGDLHRGRTRTAREPGRAPRRSGGRRQPRGPARAAELDPGRPA